MTEPDYYGILGVSPGSEDIVIQAAYRALMRRYHPDKNPSEEARKRTVEINAAYAVLGNASKRAEYDMRRHAEKSSASSGKSPPPPPPPPPPRQPANAQPSPPSEKQRGALVFASLITIGMIGIVIVAAANSTNGAVANNTMNVDENLTTTDINATRDFDATTDMNATDLNLAGAVPPDLSKQPQPPVSYSTIEGEAKRVAKIILTKGITGARAYSERCHKVVEAGPSWDGADSCAAFDYAAANIDDAVSTRGGWPKNGYFEFQSGNQPDNYATVGAPTYVTTDRLSKIRPAAEAAGIEAFRVEVARKYPDDASKPAASQPPSPAAPANTME